MKKLLIMLMVVAMASFLFVGCLGTTPPIPDEDEEPAVAVTGVTLDQATLALTIGDVAVTLVATVEPATATDTRVIWASSDEMVAVVAAGVVTPLNAGISAITATTVDGGFVATCVVTVTAVEPEPELTLVGITVDPETMELVKGKVSEPIVVTACYEVRGWGVTLDPTKCLFLTSNSKVATVDDKGLVTAKGVGTADILVTYKEKTATLGVTVTYLPMEIKVDMPLFEVVVTEVEVPDSDPVTYTYEYEGVSERFKLEIVANDDKNKRVKFYFTLPVGAYTLEYYDTDGWVDLPQGIEIILGSGIGSLLIDEVKFFRGTFDGTKAYKTTIEVWTVDKDGEKDVKLCSKDITAVVVPAPPG